MTRIRKISAILCLLFFFLHALTLKNPTFAREDSVNKGKVIYICDGKQSSNLRTFFIKIFRKQSFKKCIVKFTGTGQMPHSPTPTSYPTGNPINTPSSSPAIKPSTPKPFVSPSPTNPSIPNTTGTQPSQFWHEPKSHDSLNGHEHGDKPPLWADDFSQKNFGYPVMFGGDEATPNENILKHQAYKGFLMKVSGVDVYIRYHSMSTPTDRMGPLHSYEVYAKDSAGNISFWQGWMFHGYPNIPSQRMPRHGEQPGYDPLHNVTWSGRDQFIIAGADEHDWKDYKRCEQWYGHGGLWAWDISITICGATTYFTPNEHLSDVYNQSLWKLTGGLGGSRRLEVSHYGPNNPLVGGDNLPFNKWFCVKKLPNENKATGQTPTWDVSGAVSGPSSCQSGWLPQFVADTFPKKGVYFETGNTAEKDFPTTGVSVPN